MEKFFGDDPKAAEFCLSSLDKHQNMHEQFICIKSI